MGRFRYTDPSMVDFFRVHKQVKIPLSHGSNGIRMSVKRQNQFDFSSG